MKKSKEIERDTGAQGQRQPGGKKPLPGKKLTQAAPMQLRKYECIFLVRSELSQDMVHNIIQDISDFVRERGGTTKAREEYLLMQLPNPIKRNKRSIHRGIYIVLNIECFPHMVAALNQYIRFLVSSLLLLMITAVDEFEEGPTLLGRKPTSSYYDKDREEGSEPTSERRGSYTRRSYGSGSAEHAPANAEEKNNDLLK